MTSWDAFYDEAERRGPSLLLARAINLAGNLAAARQAVDLGCGAGKETQQLMQSGWDVLAVDNEPEAINRTIANCSGGQAGMLTTCLSDFECLPALPRSNLIHAGLALPFCRPKSFKQLWDQVLHALEPGGVFCRAFFWSPAWLVDICSLDLPLRAGHPSDVRGAGSKSSSRDANNDSDALWPTQLAPF